MFSVQQVSLERSQRAATVRERGNSYHRRYKWIGNALILMTGDVVSKQFRYFGIVINDLV